MLLAPNATALLTEVHRLMVTRKGRSAYPSTNHCQGHLQIPQSLSVVLASQYASLSGWEAAYSVSSLMMAGRGDPCLTRAHNRSWGLDIPTCQGFWPRYPHGVSGLNPAGIFCGLACTWLPLYHCWGPIYSTQCVWDYFRLVCVVSDWFRNNVMSPFSGCWFRERMIY
jgi:hypothetical protein